MDILIHPSYFPSISHFVAMIQADKITFEMDDNFQKQTNRNRMYIYGANGTQLLNIPIKKGLEHNQKYKDVRIEYDFNWRKQHFKSLESAYRTSPFFEYFEDDFRILYDKKFEFLLDLNLETHQLITDSLGIQLPFEKTDEYHKQVTDLTDLRPLIDGKKDTNQFEPYTQVFEEKYGFINNLSILDLLFNEGRYGIDYLKKQAINF